MTADRPGKITFGHLVSLGSLDRQIAVDCYDHHVLTTEQILRLHFTGLRSTTARLDILYQLRVLDRFRPSVPMGEGTAPYHWVLDEAPAVLPSGPTKPRSRQGKVVVPKAGATGLEPATSAVTGQRSNQLSYAPVLCTGPS
jgi:hypothetical protein